MSFFTTIPLTLSFLCLYSNDRSTNRSGSNNNTLRINEVKGTFQDSNVVTGANSSSSATISANGVTQPGMKPYSGDVLYIENREKITRLQNQVEDFKIVLEF